MASTHPSPPCGFSFLFTPLVDGEHSPLTPPVGFLFPFPPPLGLFTVFLQSQHPIHADSREDTIPLSHRLFDRSVERPSWPSRPPPPVDRRTDERPSWLGGRLPAELLGQTTGAWLFCETIPPSLVRRAHHFNAHYLGPLQIYFNIPRPCGRCFESSSAHCKLM